MQRVPAKADCLRDYLVMEHTLIFQKYAAKLGDAWISYFPTTVASSNCRNSGRSTERPQSFYGTGFANILKEGTGCPSVLC